MLSTAHQLFAERGFDATSVQDVLDASGVSRGALYHHFPTKADLFAGVLEEVEGNLLGDIGTAASRASSPLHALRAGCVAFLDAALNPAVQRIILLDALTALGWARWRAIDERYAFGALRAGLQAATDAGELNLAPDLLDEHAHLLLASLLELGLMITQSDHPNDTHDRAVRTIDHLLRSPD